MPWNTQLANQMMTESMEKGSLVIGNKPGSHAISLPPIYLAKIINTLVPD